MVAVPVGLRSVSNNMAGAMLVSLVLFVEVLPWDSTLGVVFPESCAHHGGRCIYA